MPNPHSLAEYVFHYILKWSIAISDPRHYLVLLPKDPDMINALEFYLATLIVAFLVHAPFVLGQKGEEKARLAANSVVGFVSGAVVAMSWHLAFSWVGGRASFAETCIAYVYSGAPYIPLMAFSSLLVFAALPADLQVYALAPATAQAAFQRGIKDPRTSKSLIVVGSLSSISIVIWSMVVLLRSLRFVHRISGLRFAGAVVIAMVLAALVAPLLKAIASVFTPPANETLDNGARDLLKPEASQLPALPSV